MTDIKPANKTKTQSAAGQAFGFYALPLELVLKELSAQLEEGLSENEARKRLSRDGPNTIEAVQKDKIGKYLINQVSSIVVWLLFVAAAVAWLTGNTIEAYAILVVLLINGLIGFAIEWQAGRALDALRKSTKTTARVRRGGKEKIIDASELVRGDVISVTAGDRVPADARIVEATNLRADESTLTGESVPVNKSGVPVSASTPLAERTPMLYLGSTIVAGHGTALVTALGARTEIGKIGELVSKTEDSQTPLEKRLANLGKRLVYVVLGVAATVFIAGMMRGDGLWLMTEVAISLAVAAVPEGLPAVTTLILALGVLRMARRNAIVRRLSAVETLGSSTVICSDKTGTLTENRMTVRQIRLSDGSNIARSGSEQDPGAELQDGLFRLLRVGVLCNEAADAEGPDSDGIGDPTETAILASAIGFGINPAELRTEFRIVHEQPFEAAKKLMKVVVESENAGRFVALKGAPSVVLEACDTYLDRNGSLSPMDSETKASFLGENQEMAGNALRVLAFAEKCLGSVSDPVNDSLDEFVFLGFLGIRDPIREGATEAVRIAHDAGIRVVMLTGDQINTARAIAVDLNLSGGSEIVALHSNDLQNGFGSRFSTMAKSADVFARVTPEDKLRIVEAFQEAGEIVAVTGDGVNDAPALKQADIGVAMGMRGTEVAKEASDIILTDDNFSTIVEAIKGGRTIYANILKFVHLMFSQNLAEVLVIFAAILAGLPLPLLPLQILWINLVTDVFPALGLAVEPPSPDSMKRKPFPPDQSMLSGKFMFLILWQGMLLASIALAAYIWALQTYGAGTHSRTVALMSVVGVQLGHMFNCRSRSRSAFDGFFGNPYMFAAAAIVIILQIMAVYLTPLSVILNTVPLNASDLIVIGITIVLPVFVVEVTKLLSTNRKSQE